MNIIDTNLMKQVLQALSITEQQYAELIEQTGHAYLNAFIKGYPQVVEQITKSKTFWQWWKHYWEKREWEFIETITDYPESVNDVAQLHHDLHDPVCLAGAQYLNGQVLQESYLNLIDAITKEQSITKKIETCQM
jgi:hypothetical protein